MDVIKVKKRNHAFLEIQCDPSIHNELVDFFAFRPDGYQFVPSYRNKMWDGFIRIYNSKDKVLPIGLYKYLQEFANTTGRDYRLELVLDVTYGLPGEITDIDVDTITKYPVSSRGTPVSPYDYQVEAVHHALTTHNALLVSPTGSGKSLIIYLALRWYLETHRGNVLVVVPSTSLVEQMYGDFRDYSQLDDTFDESLMHCIYSGREKINNQRVIIGTWQSIYKMPGSWFEPFGMVFGDEAHNAKAKSLTSLFDKCREAKWRIGTTGTLDGSKVHRLILEGIFGPVNYVIKTKQLIDDGKLAPLKIELLVLKYSEDLRRNFGKKNYQEEMDWIITHNKRNNLITNLALDLDGNTLILFNYVDKHGKPLHQMIQSKAHSRRKVFYVSGETDVKIREEVRQITETQKNAIIVASLGTFSTGINIRNLHNIIFASPSKSQIKVLQSIGRGLRLSDDGRHTTLYDIVDDLHWRKRENYTLKHGSHRLSIYSKEQFEFRIHEVEINE